MKRRNDRDEHEQRPGQDVDDRQESDQGHRRHRHDVVEEDEPQAPMPVEERAGDRRDQQPGKDAGERHQAGERRRSVSVQREEDERDADHRLRDPRDLHRQQHAAEVRDAQQLAVGAVDLGLGRGPNGRVQQQPPDPHPQPALAIGSST